MARAGMTTLITRLRRLIDDSDLTVWTNDELEDNLDQHRVRVWREPLEYDKQYTSGTAYVYREYRSRYHNLEEGGTAYFKVEDSAGSARGTGDYSADYINGVVTMNADQKGTALYLTGYAYDLNGAAADLWRERATKVSSYYDFQADGHRFSRSQWFRHCIDTANEFDKRAQAQTVRPWTVGDARNE